MTGVEASVVTPMISGLIATVLYATAYLSLVRILRYPRNWFPPPLLAILTTGALAVLTVAYVSLSSSGPDFVSFAISAGFIVVVFCIIAAPAIAFRPANRALEFLAKHADHAALWLLGPALAAGLSVPNIKLQSMLAAAMAIELSWFIRLRRADRRRQLYPLNDRDLAILQTQAKGNLKAFRRRHGIRELVFSEDVTSWRGCGKTTPPCPFNLYVNRLGLNTAPCCREHMRDIGHYVAACLSEMEAVHWLEGGSLLGAVRENGALLDWEDDVDISVLLDTDMTWDRLTVGLAERGVRDGYFIDSFEKYGFVSVSFDPPKKWPLSWERNRLRGEIRVDIAIYRQAISHGEAVLERCGHKGKMAATECGGYGVPQEIVLPTSTINFLDGKLACPNKSDAYLHILYGDFEEIEYTYIDEAAVVTRRQADRASKTRMHVAPDD